MPILRPLRLLMIKGVIILNMPKEKNPAEGGLVLASRMTSSARRALIAVLTYFGWGMIESIW